MARAHAAPLRLHPKNPRYFLFRGRSTVLLTAGEHYGAVVNRDFDYVRYLEAIRSYGFNLTRLFTGSFVAGNELASLGIVDPLSPASTPVSGRRLCRTSAKTRQPPTLSRHQERATAVNRRQKGDQFGSHQRDRRAQSVPTSRGRSRQLS